MQGNSWDLACSNVWGVLLTHSTAHTHAQTTINDEQVAAASVGETKVHKSFPRSACVFLRNRIQKRPRNKCHLTDHKMGGKLSLLGCLFPLGGRSLIRYTAEVRRRHDQPRPGGSQTQIRAARAAQTACDHAAATRKHIKRCRFGRTLRFRVLVFSLCWPQQPR